MLSKLILSCDIQTNHVTLYPTLMFLFFNKITLKCALVDGGLVVLLLDELVCLPKLALYTV